MLDVKSLINKVITTLNKTEIENKAGIKTAVSEDMSTAIEVWSRMYADAPNWASNEVKTMNLPAEIAAEFARLITIEMESEITGSARADYLNIILQQEVLEKLRQQVEYACAKGGIVLKPYIDGDTITVDFIQADCFFPISFDSSGRLTGAVFVDQIIRGKKIFTRLESQQFNDSGIYEVKNKAFMSSTKNVLGSQISLADVDQWADLQPEIVIQNVDRPLFAYFKVPFANTIDPRSALGVSVYSRAVSQIEEADKQWSRLLWEFEGSELAIDADMVALGKDSAGKLSMPRLNKRLFRGLNINGGNSGADFYKVFSPAIRDASLLNGLNAILIRVEDACGLARGTFSDPATDPKTATEILSSKQKSYSTIRDCQKSLQNALDNLVYAMDIMATLYQLSPVGTYETSYNWDDSIINNPSDSKQMFWQYVVAGKYPFWRYLVKYEGYSEDEAREIETDAQSSVSASFGFGGA